MWKKGSMARTRKSNPKRKGTRAAGAPTKRARKPPPATSKPAAKPIKSPSPDQLDDFVAAAARVLALPIEPQWLAAIKTNLEINLRLGAFVAEFALPDETEPAPVFSA
jgi:hypothetical protein